MYDCIFIRVTLRFNRNRRCRSSRRSSDISLVVFFLKDAEGKLMRVIYMPGREEESRGKTTRQNFETGDDDASPRQDAQYPRLTIQQLECKPSVSSGGDVWFGEFLFCLPLFFRGVSLCFEAFGAVVTSSSCRNISEAAGDDQGWRLRMETQRLYTENKSFTLSFRVHCKYYVDINKKTLFLESLPLNVVQFLKPSTVIST